MCCYEVIFDYGLLDRFLSGDAGAAAAAAAA